MKKCAMTSKILHLVLVIVLAYVCVLNAVIVNVFYKRFLKNKRFDPVPVVLPLRNATQRAFRGRIISPECEEERGRAVVVVTGNPQQSNDLATRAPALAQLRHALRVGNGVAETTVYLVVTAESFVGSHRGWCNALYMQTQNRASCQLLLLSSPVVTSSVFREVLRVAPCVSEAVLLPDSVQIKPSLFTRLDHTARGRVTCLVAETTEHYRCPVAAFRVPRLFLEAYTGEAPVETAARGMHMYAGGAAVVSLS